MNITIIIPSYNQGQFIEETIKSVINQSYKNFELIVIDNQSTDQTKEILRKYSSQIKVVCDKDTGQTNAINKGFKMAAGDILAYLNSDDLYEKNTLKIVADYFKKNPKIKIVYGKGKFINEKGKFLGFYKTKPPTLKNLFKECVISQPTVFMRREVYEQIGPFDESLNFAMDYDYWIKVAKKYKFYFINKTIASTRLHKQSKTSQSKKVFEEVLIVLKKNYGKVSDEAIFNYAYAVTKKSLTRIILAFKIYWQLKQIPSKQGIKFFVILFKKIFK